MTQKSKGKIRDQAPCTECGNRIWQHTRCIRCHRFIWCTALIQTSAGPTHRVCPVPIPTGDQP